MSEPTNIQLAGRKIRAVGINFLALAIMSFISFFIFNLVSTPQALTLLGGILAFLSVILIVNSGILLVEAGKHLKGKE